MRKKLSLALTIFIITASCLMTFCACDKKHSEVSLQTGGRPDLNSIISQDSLNTVNAAMLDTATEEQKKDAVMLLFDIANASRQNTHTSLMLQNSNAGISLGDVIMHGFNLKYGDAWYYQLATQATSSVPLFEALMSEIAGLLKIAYTKGDGTYHYTVIKGSSSECDCTVETFPYATFVVTGAPKVYNEADFKTELHYLSSMHEINNMKFRKEIIADGATVSYDSEKHFYTVEFSVDMDADGDMLAEWFALPKEDMAVGGQTLEYYNSYSAVLEVWDNGYAKSFKSYSDREAGLGSGKPVDEFEYLWDENEILALLKQDEGITVHDSLTSIEDYVEYYSEPELVKARLSALKIAGIVIGCVIVVIIVLIIVFEVLISKGKFPKISARREAKKQKRLAKKMKKRGITVEDEEE